MFLLLERVIDDECSIKVSIFTLSGDSSCGAKPLGSLAIHKSAHGQEFSGLSFGNVGRFSVTSSDAEGGAVVGVGSSSLISGSVHERLSTDC